VGNPNLFQAWSLPFVCQKITNLSPDKCDTPARLLDNQNNAPKRYIHPVAGRRLREPSSPSPAQEKTQAANNIFINHQQ